MFPKYQNDVLDEDNRAKRRVIVSLSKAYKNVGSTSKESFEAENLYEVLDQKFK
jgi:hypothetical protein